MLRTSFIFVIAASAALALDFTTPAEKLAGDFKFTEGPVWIASRGELLFSDIPANRIMRWKDSKAETFREPSANSNGLTLDKQGRLIACEHGNLPHRRRVGVLLVSQSSHDDCAEQ